MTSLTEPPHFLIVGSPRSGTTLVQRLASELPGVRVTPETHFFVGFYEQHLRHASFPLDATALRGLLAQFLGLKSVQGLTLDVEKIVDALDGCAQSPWHLFSAVVRQLGGDAKVVGEKTPNHLRWWRPLSEASPGLKFVVVLRDPRAVVASLKDAPFDMYTVPLLAARWAADVRETESALAALPPERIAVFRFEDVVADPDRARKQLGAFLGVSGDVVLIENQGVELFYGFEAGWKARALGPVDPTRAAGWRDKLSERERVQVEVILRRHMRKYGYAPDTPIRLAALLTLTPRDWFRLGRHYATRQRGRARTARVSLVPGRDDVR